MSEDARPPNELRAKLYAAVGPDRVERAGAGDGWGPFLAALHILWWLNSPERLAADVETLEDLVERGRVKPDEAAAPLGRMRYNLERAREAVAVLEDVGFAVETDGTIRWTGARAGAAGGQRPRALTCLVGWWWRELDLSDDLSNANLRKVAAKLRGKLPDERLDYESRTRPLYHAARRYTENPDPYGPALEALSALKRGDDP